MGMTELEQALELVREHSDEADFVGPREVALVNAAEAALGITFPPTYRRFLLELGAGDLGGEEFYGVISADFQNSGIPDAIWFTLRLRAEAGLPHGLVVIYFNSGAEYIALDTTHSSADGECPVVAWTPVGLEIVASDFGTFFLSTLQGALADS